MDKSIELHLQEARKLLPKKDEEAWPIGQVIYHLFCIANIQEARISSLEQEELFRRQQVLGNLH